ncbi:Substrate-binding region of ABC-type glycine betaine transport system [Planctomycetales bacterium 10988]|nr:Substrate-binding region of ABC-type glycine betaine transport system [Planctomycetales bacterium 10988]
MNSHCHSAMRFVICVIALLPLLNSPVHAQTDDGPLVVGSKSFTEAIILGEVATLLLRERGFEVRHERALGDASTYQALVRGNIDLYVEYTGTIRQSIFHGKNLKADEEIPAALEEDGISMTDSLGFENSFALGMKADEAEALKIKTISDLRRHPALKFGFTESFLNRGDGWPGLQRHYQLPQSNPRGMAHDLAYVALENEDLDVVDLYTTDAEIVKFDLVSLEDDQNYFPQYEAVILYRNDLEERYPGSLEVLQKLTGTIDSQMMQQLNALVKIEKESDRQAAASFLKSTFDIEVEVSQRTLWGQLWLRTKEHLFLVGVAMLLGTLVAIPLGILADWMPRLGKVILATVSILQTVPALALLALMVPLLGINSPPAIAALFCYSMLPIVRNTHAGLAGISPAYQESAEVLGLSPWQQLLKIELPLASPLIMAGIKTSTVLSIGFATLGAFIGAGGYGEPILTGIRLQDTYQILQGAIPAALMAIGAELLFDAAEGYIVPKGLRL